jgi:D-3-phosphoglycerate dehydrogenase
MALVSVKLDTSSGELWAEGTVFEHGGARLVRLDGIEIEAPLQGTLLVLRNQDRPGVIGGIGTILGRHGINIASFALGRGAAGAVGVISVDADEALTNAGADALREVRGLPGIERADFVTL